MFFILQQPGSHGIVTLDALVNRELKNPPRRAYTPTIQVHCDERRRNITVQTIPSLHHKSMQLLPLPDPSTRGQNASDGDRARQQPFFAEEPEHAPRLAGLPMLREPGHERVKARDRSLRHFVEHPARVPEAPEPRV
uniref:Uncharacterized protein n=1 Tax=Arundo donax TaxID=35708 RepID=A0A0A9DNH1_ARUDO